MSDVSAIKLYSHRDSILKPATLVDGVSRREVDIAEVSWQPYIDRKIEALKKKGIAQEDWPEHLHWDWRRKRKKTEYKLRYQWFGIKCDDKWQGLMVVETLHRARVSEQAGKEIVYIDYLATAPWNLAEFVDEPEYGLVGSIFIKTAIQLSLDLEFKGRIGLNSLPQSEKFYRDKCGMTDLGPDPHYGDSCLRYFEMTPAQAREFIK